VRGALIVLKPGLVGRPESEIRPVEEKIEEEKTRCDPADTVKNPVATH